MANVKYEDLINKNGTIYTKSGKAYSSEAQLAADLGIQPHQIDWTKIEPEKKDTTSTQKTDSGNLGSDELWEYWQEIRENETGIGPKLYEVYSKRKDLQRVFDGNGNARPGSGAEGFTLEHWAMKYGWMEEKDLVMYKPENVVRATYRFPFRGTDPLASETYDAGAVDWINAIKDGIITSSASLLGRMKTDSGGEWGSLTEAEKAALTIDAYLPVESLADIPKFSEFFDEEKVRSEIEKRTNELYDKQLNDYIEGQEIVERRTIEDWQDLTKEISEEEEKGLSDTQKQFRQSLKQATEGYAAAGLTYSSIRKEGEGLLREGLGRGKEEIQTLAQRKQKEAELTKTRTLEDIAREKKLKTEEVQKRLKPAEIETALTQRRGEALTQYKALKSGVLTPEEIK